MTRDDLHKQGAALRDELGMATTAVGTTTGIDAFLTESVYGAVWSRGVLSLQERMICTLATLSALARGEELSPMVEAALRIGVEPRAIVEVFAQAGLYGGFGATERAIAAAQAVFAARGLAIPQEPPRTDSLEALTARGQEFLADLHGERGTQGYASPDNPTTGTLYVLATQYGYGELWLRPGLDRRERLLCALASFTVLGLETQLRKFSLSALRVGFSRQEVIEAVIQTAPYGGFPRALNALAVFGEAAAENA